MSAESPEPPNKEDKRERRKKRARESTGSASSENSLTTCCSCLKLEEKFDKITAKLESVIDKLSDLESVKAAIVKLLVENANIIKNASFTDETVLRTKREVDVLKEESEILNDDLNKMKESLKSLEARNIRLEAQHRRSNMKFYGISELDNETPSKTKELLQKFILDKMKITDEVTFERVHRLGSRTVSSDRPRPIIAKFSFYQQKQDIWRSVRNLKGSRCAISDDYPKEIDKIRKTLYAVLKEAKRYHHRAFFNVDKLIINGQVYRGEETKNLPFYGSIMDLQKGN